MPYIKTPSGINWFYEMKGNGEMILFIHGWSGDSGNWWIQTEYFKNYFCVITPDLPGHGQSNYRKIDFDGLVKDIFFLCKELKLDKVNLVGASFGGMIAIKFAAGFAPILNKLVLVDTTAKFVKSKDFEAGMSKVALKNMQRFMDTDFPNILIVFARSLFTEEERSQKNFPDIWQSIISLKKLPQRQALKQFLTHLEKMDLRESLPNITVPTLIVCGESDSICPAGGSVYLNKHIKDSQLRFFKKTGHLPFLTRSDEFNKIVKEFLE